MLTGRVLKVFLDKEYKMIEKNELVKIIILMAVVAVIFTGMQYFKKSDQNVKIQSHKHETGTTYTGEHGHERHVHGAAE